MGEAWSAGPNRPPDGDRKEGLQGDRVEGFQGDRKGRPYISFAGGKKSIPVSEAIASL